MATQAQLHVHLHWDESQVVVPSGLGLKISTFVLGLLNKYHILLLIVIKNIQIYNNNSFASMVYSADNMYANANKNNI